MVIRLSFDRHEEEVLVNPEGDLVSYEDYQKLELLNRNLIKAINEHGYDVLLCDEHVTFYRVK